MNGGEGTPLSPDFSQGPSALSEIPATLTSGNLMEIAQQLTLPLHVVVVLEWVEWLERREAYLDAVKELDKRINEALG